LHVLMEISIKFIVKILKMFFKNELSSYL
jgi:hypothetical protein